jgi:hypothetical protein
LRTNNEIQVINKYSKKIEVIHQFENLDYGFCVDEKYLYIINDNYLSVYEKY